MSSREDVEVAVDVTLVEPPLLVMVLLHDAWLAPHLLAFVRLLRRRRYGGHVTAGGSLAAWSRHDRLVGPRGFDSVVVHDAEARWVELVERLRAAPPWGAPDVLTAPSSMTRFDRAPLEEGPAERPSRPLATVPALTLRLSSWRSLPRV